MDFDPDVLPRQGTSLLIADLKLEEEELLATMPRFSTIQFPEDRRQSTIKCLRRETINPKISKETERDKSTQFPGEGDGECCSMCGRKF